MFGNRLVRDSPRRAYLPLVSAGQTSVDIVTEAALALTLAVDGERVDVYFEFEEDLADDRLGRLLALIGSCVTIFDSVPDDGAAGAGVKRF